MVTSLTESLAQTGDLERWLVVAKEEGPPVTVTVYCHFSRQGDLALRAEVFGQPGEWRLGNVRSPGPSEKGPPQWETGATACLRIHVWPGFSLAEYLTGRYGPDSLRQLLKAIGEGGEPLEALEDVTGQTVDDFTCSWHRWLRDGMPAGSAGP